jgi:hypothetical protein
MTSFLSITDAIRPDAPVGAPIGDATPSGIPADASPSAVKATAAPTSSATAANNKAIAFIIIINLQFC